MHLQKGAKNLSKPEVGDHHHLGGKIFGGFAIEAEEGGEFRKRDKERKKSFFWRTEGVHGEVLEEYNPVGNVSMGASGRDKEKHRM